MNRPSPRTHWSPLLLGALALGASLWSARADYASEVISRSPVAYYRLNETVPTNATVAINSGSLGAAGDGAYGSHVVHPTSGALPSQPGNGGATLSGGALLTSASASTITIPYQADLNVAGPFTFEFWAKPLDAASRCAAGSIVLGNSGWLFYQSTLVANQWSFRTISTGLANQNVSGGTVTPGQWQHVVGVWDGATNRLYVNGVQVATLAAATFQPNSTLQLALGNRSALDFTPFGGSMDEAAYYTNALSAARILAHYQAGTNAAPAPAYDVEVGADLPVGYWRLNEGRGAIVAVNSGTTGAAGNGNFLGSTTSGTGPQPAAQPGFEATNGAVALTSASAGWVAPGSGASLSGTTDFSVSAWVKTTATAEGIIVQQRDASGLGYEGQYRFFMNADGTVHFFVYQGGFQFDFSTATAINDGNWHQVVAVRQGANGYIYVDDQAPVTASGTVKALVGTLNTYIGRDMRDNVAGFEGSIDEVAIFGSALGQGTIQSLYYTAIGSNTVFMVTDPPTVSPAGTIYATTTFNITADAAGPLPLTYQWRLNGTNVGSPSTSPVYTKVNCSTNDSGPYDVIVSNLSASSVTSSVVTVTVDPTVIASIGTQPQSLTIYSNYDAGFSVVAAGTPPFTYQWKHAGTNLPNATNATLNLTQCGSDQLGTYTVAVTNILGGTLSDPATLSFFTQSSMYEATITGKRPWAYWRFNEGGGTTATNIGLNSVVNYVAGTTNSGTYAADLTFGSDLQSPAFLGFETTNAATIFPGASAVATDGAIDAGTGSSLGGTNDFSVTLWVKTGTAQEAVLIQQRDQSGSGFLGQYKVSMNAAGKVYFFLYGTENSFQFNIVGATTVSDGNWHMVTAVRQGTAGRLYVDGVLDASGSGTVKTLSSTLKVYIGRDVRDATFGGAGAFPAFNGAIDEVAIHTAALSGSEIQDLYSIGRFASIVTPAFFVAQPVSITRYAGATASFAVSAGGTAPLYYQWRKGGASISGATNATLTIPGVTAADATNYSCAISNALPGVVSSNAALTVITLTPGTYGAKLGALGPLAYWRLNETNGEVAAADLVGGHHGAYEGIITQAVAGPTSVSFEPNNTGCFFDGTFPSDLSCGNVSGMDGYIDFTVTAWVRTTGVTTGAVISQRDTVTVGGEGDYKLSVLADGNVNFFLYALGGVYQFGAGGLSTTNIIANDGNWHHIVAMRSGDTGSIYVDGVLAATATDAVNQVVLNSTTRTFIGRHQKANDEPFNGDLDEVAVFNRALTPLEIADIAPPVAPPAPPTLSIAPSGADVVVTWSAGSLLQAPTINGPWTTNTGAVSPYTVPHTNSALFFRARVP